jgi:hypothetical protein
MRRGNANANVNAKPRHSTTQSDCERDRRPQFAIDMCESFKFTTAACASSPCHSNKHYVVPQNVTRFEPGMDRLTHFFLTFSIFLFFSPYGCLQTLLFAKPVVCKPRLLQYLPYTPWYTTTQLVGYTIEMATRWRADRQAAHGRGRVKARIACASGECCARASLYCAQERASQRERLTGRENKKK